MERSAASARLACSLSRDGREVELVELVELAETVETGVGCTFGMELLISGIIFGGSKAEEEESLRLGLGRLISPHIVGTKEQSIVMARGLNLKEGHWMEWMKVRTYGVGNQEAYLPGRNKNDRGC